jgi:GPH family glycoside/pentoside/hexuronide:cation symporter
LTQIDGVTGADSLDLMPQAARDDGRPITRGLYASYGVGMIGERMFRDTPALLLLVFMTNYLGIPAYIAGISVFIPKFVVVFLDPLVGIFSDGIRSSWGRRRPLMFVGALLTSASFFVMFYVPHIDNVWWRAAYMSMTITLAFIAYALFSVPYLTMASEMTADKAEHTKLMSVRVTFMAIGLAMGANAGAIVQYGGGGLEGYRFMAMVFAIICVVTMLLTVFGTARARQFAPDGAALGLIAQFRLARRNRRYMLLLAVNAFQKLGEGIGYGSFAYFIVYYVHQSMSDMGLVVIGTLAGQVACQPFWIWLNGRASRPVVYTIGIAAWVLALVVWLFLADAPMWALIGMGVWSGISAGGFLGVLLMMLADSISHDAEATGIKREGTFSGIWLATEKVGFALGALIVGVVLQLFHFVSSSSGIEAPQSAEAILGIAVVYVGLNSLVYCASIVPVWLYSRYDHAKPG